jgi:amino acid transporter, AAT family
LKEVGVLSNVVKENSVKVSDESRETNDELLAREKGLKRHLTKAQLTMIAMGGAIGTGLFLGSGFAV